MDLIRRLVFSLNNAKNKALHTFPIQSIFKFFKLNTLKQTKSDN